MAENAVPEHFDRIQILKSVGLGIATLMLNHFLFGRYWQQQVKKGAKPVSLPLTVRKLESMKDVIMREESSKLIELLIKKDENQEWGQLKIPSSMISEDDGLLRELNSMNSLLFEVDRVNNLIIDLELAEFSGIPSPLVRRAESHTYRAYMNENTLVKPGEFVIKQCMFKPGKILELEKKFMRAGPRSTQYFTTKEVVADIVCLGGLCPGMNTVIRELVLILLELYGAKKVYGVKDSFKGYYEHNFIELTPSMMRTAHHQGGCMLGLSTTGFEAKTIVNSLIDRGVNQVYLIGANNTLIATRALYEEIKKRRLNISVTVILKGINRDVPVFDTCFGFQTAAEESSKIIERAHAFCHSFANGVSLVRVPGVNSGFLAAQSVLSTINANACLIPECGYNLYGDNGLLEYLLVYLSYIMRRVKAKGNCLIVYSEGAENSVRDCKVPYHKNLGVHKSQFEDFLQAQITKILKGNKIFPSKIGVFNGVEEVRSAPANSLDTKLCWQFHMYLSQIAQSSIHCVMSGYTNFATGHLANRNAMVSIDTLIHDENSTKMRVHEELWQRVIASTNQDKFMEIEFKEQ